MTPHASKPDKGACGKSRVLAVDPGDVRIGVAISDPTATIARPLKVLTHVSREQDARAILALAEEHDAARIVVGVPYDLEGKAGPQARKALRLLGKLASMTELPVEAWDESGSTQAAEAVPGGRAPLDARAAAVILQDYLNANKR